jgi:hypothetical protein
LSHLPQNWSVTNLDDMSQRHAPPELYRHIISKINLTPAQQQTIALGLTIFHELLLNLKAEQTRLQQQLQQALQRVQGSAPAAAATTATAGLQEQQQQLQALLARQDELAWLQPASVQAHGMLPAATAAVIAAAPLKLAAACDVGVAARELPPASVQAHDVLQPAAAGAATAALAGPGAACGCSVAARELQPASVQAPVVQPAPAAAVVEPSAAACASLELLSLLDQGQADLDQQHQLLQRVETNNWQLSWMICLLNFFISGVLDLPQLCKCVVYSYPWPWWPGPFAEEVLWMYNEQQQQQQQVQNGRAS